MERSKNNFPVSRVAAHTPCAVRLLRHTECLCYFPASRFSVAPGRRRRAPLGVRSQRVENNRLPGTVQMPAVRRSPPVERHGQDKQLTRPVRDPKLESGTACGAAGRVYRIPLSHTWDLKTRLASRKERHIMQNQTIQMDSKQTRRHFLQAAATGAAASLVVGAGSGFQRQGEGYQ